jgi:hypothetical protein
MATYIRDSNKIGNEIIRLEQNLSDPGVLLKIADLMKRMRNLFETFYKAEKKGTKRYGTIWLKLFTQDMCLTALLLHMDTIKYKPAIYKKVYKEIKDTQRVILKGTQV